MNRRVTRGLRLTLLAHAITYGLVGAQHLFAPRVWTDFVGMTITETATWRFIGAALLGLALGSALAYRDSRWESVRTIVIVHTCWSTLGAAVVLWGIAYESLPPRQWLNAGLLAAFALVFGDWSTGFGTPDGTLFVAEPPTGDVEVWRFEELTVPAREDRRLGEFLLSFGQDTDLELYALTSQMSGPTGDTGTVYRIVPPE